MHVLPVSSFFPVCPKFLDPRRGFSCHRFPSLVERREPCRYTSESAGVARLAPCPICRFASFFRVKHLREVGPLSRPVMWSMRLTQPVSAPLQSSLRFLPDLLSAPPSVHLAMYFPLLLGSGMDLSCSARMTR